MQKQDSKINCRTFQEQQLVIEHITEEVNGAGDATEKVEFARKLQREVEVLVLCPEYDEESADCSKCRFIITLLQKTVDLVIRAKKLV